MDSMSYLFHCQSEYHIHDAKLPDTIPTLPRVSHERDGFINEDHAAHGI